MSNRDRLKRLFMTMEDDDVKAFMYRMLEVAHKHHAEHVTAEMKASCQRAEAYAKDMQIFQALTFVVYLPACRFELINWIPTPERFIWFLDETQRMYAFVMKAATITGERSEIIGDLAAVSPTHLGSILRSRYIHH